MKNALNVTVIVLLCLTHVQAQEKKLIANVSHDGKLVEIKFDSSEPLPESFASNAGDVQRYRLVELEPRDQPDLIIRDRSEWIDHTKVPECSGVGCPELRIWLNQQLPASQTFILAISRFRKDGTGITVRFIGSPPVLAPGPPPLAQIMSGPDVYRQQSQLQLFSKEEITVTPTVKVNRVYYEISADGITLNKKSDVFVATVQALPDRHILNLDGKLVLGKEHILFIDKGITNSAGQSIRAEGTVKIAGIPTKPDEVRLDTNWATIAAVHQKPVFEVTGKYNPIRIERVRGTEWLWEPVLNVDVGLRSTKSANSVILAPLNFSNIFLENFSAFQRGTHKSPAPRLRSGVVEKPDRSYNYADWLSTPWYRPSNVRFTVGPKAEFDRLFKRKNLLGSLRFDINFHRWNASIAQRRALIEDDFGKEAAADVRLNYGVKIIPFLAFDFGGHANNETVKKKVKGQEISVLVPRHKIFRSYFGVNSIFEINKFSFPFTITIEEWLVHIGTRELIGFTTDDGPFLKPIRGFHHRGKATFAFAIDPSKHYNLTLTYENGRQAPNFEYLNKVTTGIKVIY